MDDLIFNLEKEKQKMDDIFTSKVSKIKSPVPSRPVVWHGSANDQNKLLLIRLGTFGFVTSDLRVEAINSTLLIEGKKHGAGNNLKDELRIEFDLTNDVDVLNVFKDGDQLIILLIYDRPNLMQDRSIDIIEIST